MQVDDTMKTEASVLVLGMFDGVHIGHQTLLQKAREIADEKQIPMVVLTFDPHPLTLIAPGMAPVMLTTPEQRMRLLKAQGADIVSVIPFTEELRDITPDMFVEMLVHNWHPETVVVGFNYNFGKHGAGTPASLRVLGEKAGFETIIMPEVCLDGETVSSTRIRQLLSGDKTSDAERLLGYDVTSAEKPKKA